MTTTITFGGTIVARSFDTKVCEQLVALKATNIVVDNGTPSSKKRRSMSLEARQNISRGVKRSNAKKKAKEDVHPLRR